MLGISSVTSALSAPGVPSRDVFGVVSPSKRMGADRLSQHVQVNLSWTADLRKSTLSAMTEKSGTVQAMLETLEKIEARIESIQSYANELITYGDNVGAMTSIFAFQTALGGRIEAFVAMMSAYRDKQAMLDAQLNGAGVFMPVGSLAVEENGLLSTEAIEKLLEGIQGRLSCDVEGEGYGADVSTARKEIGLISQEKMEAFLLTMRERLGDKTDPNGPPPLEVVVSGLDTDQYGMMSQEAIDELLEGLYLRLESIKEAKSFLTEQQRQWTVQTEALQQEVIAAEAHEIQNPTLATEMATLVGTQMRKGVTVYRDMDGAGRTGVRLAALLRDNVSLMTQ